MDKIGEFSWTLLMNCRGQNVHENSSLFLGEFLWTFFGEFSWTFLVNFHGHFFDSIEKSYILSYQAITKPNLT